jgi:hypothetical protein
MSRQCFVSIDVEEDLVAGESVLAFDGVAAFSSVLPVFARHGVTATLFCTGRVIERHATLLKSFRQAGHEIALHGYYDHVPMSEQSFDVRETLLSKHIQLYIDTFGTFPKGFRAVQNVIDEAGMALLVAKQLSYDSSILSYYPPGKSYVGYCGPAPREVYVPHAANIRSKGDMEIVEIPLVPLIGGVQLQGRWLMKLRPSNMKLLLAVKKPPLLSCSFHSWDVLAPSCIRDIDVVLGYVKKHYSFSTGDALYEHSK